MVDSFIETDDYNAIYTNKNSHVQLDVNGVISALRHVSATSNLGIPAVSMIDQGHTRSDCFLISDERTKHDGFDETTRRNQGLLTQQKSAFVGGIHTKESDLNGLQSTNNMNLSDRLLSVVSSHACEWCKWCKCCKSHVAKSTMEPQRTTIEIHQKAIDPQQTAMDLQRTVIDFQQTAIDQQPTAMDQQQTAMDQQRTAKDQQRTAMDQQRTAIDTQQTELDSRKKYGSSTEAAIAGTVPTVMNLKKRKWRRKFHRNNSGYSFTEAVTRPPGLRGTITQKSLHITFKSKDLSSSSVTPRTRNWLKRSKKCKKIKKMSSAKSTDDESSFTATVIG